jgi:NAD(P)H-flavin reductase
VTLAPQISAANPWLSHTIQIAEITPEIPGVATYHFAFADAREAARYRFKPGQFNMIYLPGVGESAISLSANPASRDRWSHTIRVAGNVTQALARLGTGATLGLRGPYGSYWPIDRCADHDIVLVAGGIGLAPLRPAIYQIIDHRAEYGRVTLLYGARTPEGLLYSREYDDWRAHGIDVQTTVDRATAGWNGYVGVAILLLARLPLPRPDQTTVLVCGPEVMMHLTGRSALARGIAAGHLWLSSERNMQCAVGLCGHCQLGPTFVCKDGPVFGYDHIAPFLSIEGL